MDKPETEKGGPDGHTDGPEAGGVARRKGGVGGSGA